jgi:hypothetical protein
MAAAWKSLESKKLPEASARLSRLDSLKIVPVPTDAEIWWMWIHGK